MRHQPFLFPDAVVVQSGDTPETIGEASLLTAQTCFPNDGLDGGNGHDPQDVLCESFTASIDLKLIAT
jgi:hypothetical protein